MSSTSRCEEEADLKGGDAGKAEQCGQYHTPIPRAAQRNERKREHRQTGSKGERREERTSESREPLRRPCECDRTEQPKADSDRQSPRPHPVPRSHGATE